MMSNFDFSPLFPLEEYKHVGGFGNDTGETGLIDVDLYDEEFHRDFNDICDEIYSKSDEQKRL
jgi:hypothetical protein